MSNPVNRSEHAPPERRRTSADGSRVRWLRSCARVACALLSATLLTLGATEVAAAQAWTDGPGAVVDAAHDARDDSDSRDAPSGQDTDAPCDEGTSDPSSPEGEELPESADGEVGYVPRPGVQELCGIHPPPCDLTQDLVSRDHALVSQYRPDGLDRPPRA